MINSYASGLFSHKIVKVKANQKAVTSSSEGKSSKALIRNDAASHQALASAIPARSLTDLTIK